MVVNRSKKIGIVMAGIFAILISFGAYYYSCYERGPIYEFNAARDTQPILDIFDKNWYWLIANDDSSPAFMLKYRTHNENPTNFGKLIIKVMRSSCAKASSFAKASKD